GPQTKIHPSRHNVAAGVNSMTSFLLRRGHRLLAPIARFLSRRLLRLAGFRWSRSRCQHAALLKHFAADLVQQVWIVAQKLLRVLATLAQSHLAVAQPGAAFFD